MRRQPVGLAIFILYGVAALAQTQRTLPINHAEPSQFAELATAVRSIAMIEQVSVDADSRNLNVKSTPEQVAFAEWALKYLDRPRGTQPQEHETSPEYRVKAGTDDVARVFYPGRTGTVAGLQELATVIRSLGEIRQVFTFNSPPAIILRGTSAQMALAEWLFNELDKAPVPNSATAPFAMPGANDDVARVFFLTSTPTPKEFQDAVVSIRKQTMIRRVFTYNAPRAMALRGTPSQLDEAARLVQQMAK